MYHSSAPEAGVPEAGLGKERGVVAVVGCCRLSSEELEGKWAVEGGEAVAEEPGSFVAVRTVGDATEIVSSRTSIQNYFYTVVGGRLVHGRTVLDVLGKAGLGWEWDWDAVADMVRVEHLTQDETFHPRIRKVPQACVMRCIGGRLTVHRLPPLNFGKGVSRPEEALEAFNESVALWGRGQPPMLLMSGGFDSRAILASLLQAGVRPLLLTYGSPSSTDVAIVLRIAQSLGLGVRHVAGDPAGDLKDLLEEGERIAARTNGAITANHWVFSTYARRGEPYPPGLCLTGIGGEMARNGFLDRGNFSKVFNRLPRAAFAQFIRFKWRHRPFQPDEFPLMPPALAERLSEDGREAQVARFLAACPGSPLRALARFYFDQRVRQFMGNVIEMLGPPLRPVAPFLSARWLDTVARLPLDWCLGSNWHRFAIARNWPSLMEFPVVGYHVTRPVMAMRAPPFYWLRRFRATRTAPYFDGDGLLMNAAVAEAILAAADNPFNVVGGELIREGLARETEIGPRLRLRRFLFTLTRFARAIEMELASARPNG